jgi:hypothetical protein
MSVNERDLSTFASSSAAACVNVLPVGVRGAYRRAAVSALPVDQRVARSNRRQNFCSQSASGKAPEYLYVIEVAHDDMLRSLFARAATRAPASPLGVARRVLSAVFIARV